MVTSTIRKCQSKKHSGGGCDDPKCPEKVAYNAMLDNSVKTLNFDDFSKAKSKLDEKTTAQHIDSLMRKTGYVEPNKVAEIKKNIALLTRAENEYREVQVKNYETTDSFERSQRGYNMAIKNKDSYGAKTIETKESIKKISEEIIKINQNTVDNYKKIETCSSVINDLSKNNLTNFLNRKENEKLIERNQGKITALKERLIEDKQTLSTLQNQEYTEQKKLLGYQNDFERHLIESYGYERTMNDHRKSAEAAYHQLSKIEDKHNKIKQEVFSSFNKINATMLPQSILNQPEFESKSTISNYNRLKEYSSLAAYNKQVALIKLGSISEPEKKRQLFKLKESFSNNLIEVRDKEVSRYHAGLKTRFKTLDAVKEDSAKMLNFLGEFNKSPLGTVFDY